MANPYKHFVIYNLYTEMVLGSSCAFLTVMSVVEQLEQGSEHIDIFQAVRKLRLVRPQAVQNVVSKHIEQLNVCFELLQCTECYFS